MKATHYWRPTSTVPDRRKEVLVDVDGPLAMFDQAVLDIVREVTGRQYVLEDIKTWEIFESIEKDNLEVKSAVYAKVKAKGGCLGIPVRAGSPEGIKALQKVADVVIVTSPFSGSETWVHERDMWLKKYFKIEHSEIIYAARKYHVAGDILVDDKPEHLEKWSLRFPSGKPLLWGLSHNRGATDFTRVSSWEEVISYV